MATSSRDVSVTAAACSVFAASAGAGVSAAAVSSAGFSFSLFGCGCFRCGFRRRFRRCAVADHKHNDAGLRTGALEFVIAQGCDGGTDIGRQVSNT